MAAGEAPIRQAVKWIEAELQANPKADRLTLVSNRQDHLPGAASRRLPSIAAEIRRRPGVARPAPMAELHGNPDFGTVPGHPQRARSSSGKESRE